MPKFAWQGKTSSGTTQKGVMEAPNAEAVIATLRGQNIVPIDGTVKKQLDLSMELNIPGLGGSVGDKDLIIFTRQFATMIDAGLPLVQCLDILSSEMENRMFASVLKTIKEEVESGSTFADALGKHPKVFNQLYVNMIHAGEIGGILDTILNRLASTIEKAMRLKKQIKGAMVYPIVVLTIAVGVVALLLMVVIPMFAEMYSSLGGTLPGLTQMVMDLSDWLVKEFGWAYIIGGSGTVYAIIRLMQSNPKTEMMLHKFYLAIPVIGDLIQKTAVASFTRTLGTMVASGVPILDGLEICAKVSGNRVVEADIQHVRSGISEGKTMVEPLKESKVFPPMVVQMIGVGEQTGAMDAMLTKIADFYEEEVDDAVSALTSLMEPMLMVFLGVTVGTIAIAMYMPLFKIVDILS